VKRPGAVCEENPRLGHAARANRTRSSKGVRKLRQLIPGRADDRSLWDGPNV